MYWKLLAEMNYLQQVIAHGAARLAIGKMMLDAGLLTQFERAVDVFG